MAKGIGVSRWKYKLLYALLAVEVVIAPPLVAGSGWAIVQSSYGPDNVVFEIFGLAATLALAVVVGLELSRLRRAGFAAMLPVILFAVVCSHFIVQISEYTQWMPDYGCYWRAAEALERGINPYAPGGYLYPPLVADAMVLAHQCALRVGGSWDTVFYAWQCAQFFLALAAYGLSVRFARVLGAKGLAASVLVAVVFLVNLPLVRTFRFDQPNLWMLDVILFALVFGDRLAWVSGGLLALAAHVKLYPVAVLLPLAMTERWRSIVAFALIGLEIALLEIVYSPFPAGWSRFITFMGGFRQGEAFRDNGLHSVVSNTVQFCGHLIGLSGTAEFMIIQVLWPSLAAAAGIYVALRMIRRERSYQVLPADDAKAAEALRFTGHVLDVMSFALLASPIVWEHHYVLALPLVLYAIIARHRERPWLVGIGAALILLPPAIDVFPFGFHRIVGLVMLMLATKPEIDLAGHERNVRDWCFGNLVSETQDSPN